MLLEYSLILPPPPKPLPGSFLRVSGTNITNESNKTVLLRGCGLGGYLSMENSITGFPGHEQRFRETLLSTLGPDVYEFFFDRYLYHFFNETDLKLFTSLGLNCIRVPLDYRHFEDDMDPCVLKPGGFRHLDRIISLCAKAGVYTILDLHAVPGGQNPSSQSNNVTGHAAFWDHKTHQDRVIWLWQQIAERYKSNPWVAGYKPLSEPADRSYLAKKLVGWYQRVEKAIREVDDRHILFWDGNVATDWTGFETLVDCGSGGSKKAGIFPNSVYSCHDYGVGSICIETEFPEKRADGKEEDIWVF